ncbi:MAG: hypothetical protein P8H59_09580 [Flavobacteriales bacterium]|nr:hypothetical protein [Flavobacteriales bacterium]MDG1781190.1 hypothetical protein [Flavobacteriales bacterium]MDG2246694.1 hypothetical protein [Flavobacteriales bacterium]
MTPAEELYHQVLQKLIIVFLGLLTLSVVLTSCTPQHQKCSAYSDVDVEKVEVDLEE